MPQFTKGKWYAGDEDKYGPYVYDRLIAEAPMMYDLLNQAFEALPDDHPLRYDIDACFCHVEGVPVPDPDDKDKYPDRNENSHITLDETIQHALDTADSCGACAENLKQLAAWLTELKYLKNRKRD